MADELWRQRFVAYEDALGSFYALQDETQSTLEQSYSIGKQLGQLAGLRSGVLEARRQLRELGDGRRVAEIERRTATLELDGVRFDVMDLVANRTSSDTTILELSFRADPQAIPQFVNLTAPVRIKFPFGESTYVAACRLIRFRMVRDVFVFRFATVDPT